MFDNDNLPKGADRILRHKCLTINSDCLLSVHSLSRKLPSHYQTGLRLIAIQDGFYMDGFHRLLKIVRMLIWQMPESVVFCLELNIWSILTRPKVVTAILK